MAKTKRSRRFRRQETEKQRNTALDEAVAVATPEATLDTLPPPVIRNVSKTSGVTPSADVNFGQEYFYVYHELRNILLITVLLLAVLIGLSFII